MADSSTVTMILPTARPDLERSRAALSSTTSVPRRSYFDCKAASVGFRTGPGARARAAINWQVLLTIGAAIGLGAAVSSSGLSTIAASGFLEVTSLMGDSPRLAVFMMIITTSLLAQLITNYAAATIMFGVGMSAAELLGVRPEPFMFALMAGGDVQGGQVIGATDDHASEPTGTGYSPEDLAATFFQNIGINPQHEFQTNVGRPINLIRDGRPIEQLFS